MMGYADMTGRMKLILQEGQEADLYAEWLLSDPFLLVDVAEGVH